MAIEDFWATADTADQLALHDGLKEAEKVEAFAVVKSPSGDIAQQRQISRPPNTLLDAAGAPRVSVVIPARNEARNLPGVLSRLPAGIHEVILVDGHSTDDTISVARRHYPGILVLQETRPGKGNALHCGFQAASGDIIVTLDADGSADPAEIPRFVAALANGADFAKGSRFLPQGGSSDITRLRRLGNLLFTILVNGLFGTRYTDLCYGYNAFWARCLPLLRVDCDGFEVETLLNIRAVKAGLIVTEVGSFEGRRLYGVSNLHAYRDGRRVLKTILRERLSVVTRRADRAAWGGSTVAATADLPIAEVDYT